MITIRRRPMGADPDTNIRTYMWTDWLYPKTDDGTGGGNYKAIGLYEYQNQLVLGELIYYTNWTGIGCAIGPDPRPDLEKYVYLTNSAKSNRIDYHSVSIYNVIKEFNTSYTLPSKLESEIYRLKLLKYDKLKNIGY